MSSPISVGDVILIANGLVAASKSLRDSIPNFIELIFQFDLFYRSLCAAEELYKSGRLSSKQKSHAKQIFRGCKRVLDDLENFLDKRSSLTTEYPTFKDMASVTPGKVKDWLERIQAQKSYLIIFHTEHASTCLIDIKRSGLETNRTVAQAKQAILETKQIARDTLKSTDNLKQALDFLVSRELSRIQASSSISVCTTDSLSTNGEHWAAIRRRLESKGISPGVLKQYGDEVISQMEKIVKAGEKDPIFTNATDIRKDLLAATEQNDWSEVKRILVDNPSLGLESIEARLTSQLAMLRHAWDVVEILVNRGSDPNEKSADGQPAICVAAACGAWDTVRILANRADLEARDSSDHNALLRAAFLCCWDMVYYLADVGANLKAVAVGPVDDAAGRPLSRTTVVSYAVTYHAWDHVARLLERGADANSLSLTGDPILITAAQFARWDIVGLLVRHGADVNAEDKAGDRVLDYVSEARLCELIESSKGENVGLEDLEVYLLEEGAERGTRSQDTSAFQLPPLKSQAEQWGVWKGGVWRQL